MARKSGSTAVQEELYPLPRAASEHDEPEARQRESFDNARLVDLGPDLDAEQESPFLRGQKRVSVRRGSLPKKTATRLKWALLALAAMAIVAAAAALLYDYGKHSWRFRIDSSDQIEVAGAQHVSHAQIMDVMGGDIGRNIFFVPLSQRKQQLEQIPWVESASVMRFVPNRLRIEIHERTPVAFARIGSHISLIDAGGNLMELTLGVKHRYSFPVIAGMNGGEPLSTRAARMKIYNAVVRDLDAGGAHYSQELSEVDLSDPDDAKVMAPDPNGEVLVHLGAGNYLQRYKTYVTHVQQWRQQFEKLESVDLRYDGQIIVNPDLNGMARQPALTPAAAKAAMAAGVKTAAIVNYEKYAAHPVAPLPAKPVKKDARADAKANPRAAELKEKSAKEKLAKEKSTKEKRVNDKNAKQKSAPPQVAVNREPVKTPANPASTKTKPNTTPDSAAASHRISPVVSAPPVSGTAAQKKPSAAIPKEPSQN